MEGRKIKGVFNEIELNINTDNQQKDILNKEEE